jgi:SHS2 domain-containing protein
MRPQATTLEHVGEWKVSLIADTPEELFVELARVIARSVSVPGPEAGPWEPVVLRARDTATLLADWANELLGRSEVASRAYAEVRGLRLTPHSGGEVELSGEVRGDPVPAWTSPLKAATYHALSLERTGGRWRAVILLDV